MKEPSFTTAFFVNKTPEEVFDTVKNVRGWWSEGIEGSAEKLGDEFSYRYEDLHYSRQKLVEAIPASKIVWLVLDDAYLKFTEDKSEWKGSRLCFEISKGSDKTEVRFTHVGLVQARECFDACSSAWTFYVGESLRGLITTGRGQPDSKEKGRRPEPESALENTK